MLSGRSEKEYAKEAQAAAEAPDDAAGPTQPAENGADAENDLEAVVAMWSARRRGSSPGLVARPARTEPPRSPAITRRVS
jgi:hypothetical protein